MAKIGYLGAGTWGYCLAMLLASKGHEVISWTRNPSLADQLNTTGTHPHLKTGKIRAKVRFTTDLKETVENAELLVESVTSQGIRPVFTEIRRLGIPTCPIVITSKGIEQGTGLILSDVVIEILGQKRRDAVSALSGPGYAQEVLNLLPTSVVAAAYNPTVMHRVCDLFTTQTFRVYPNSDVRGVAFGGALKNIIAIACGISDGLQYGNSAKAALMTRGLHEMRKLGLSLGCKAETFYGLAGMGDIFLTCSSPMSRNFRFGTLLAQGKSAEEAQKEIDMVVEGAYTCVSALELAERQAIDIPITKKVYQIIYENLRASEAVKSLMSRTIKEEHL